MRPADNVEETVKEMHFEALPKMRRRIWADVSEAHDKRKMSKSAQARAGLWRTIMYARITKLAAAAVIVVAAFTLGVERLVSVRSDKVHAYRAQIHGNTALDLDPAAAIPFSDKRPNGFDVAWDSEGGGALLVTAGSSARILALPIAKNWDLAMFRARDTLAELRESTSTRVLANQSKFVAVLTSEANLAVVEISQYDADGAWLRWRLERPSTLGFGPVQVVTLYDAGNPAAQQKDHAIDFDTGEIFTIPPHVLQMSGDEVIEWFALSGIDAVAETTGEELALSGANLVFHALPPHVWTTIEAVQLKDHMEASVFQPRTPMRFNKDQYQFTFIYQTREGGLGVLQMREADDATQMVKFRYRMLEEGAGRPAQDEDVEQQLLSKSAENIKKLGLTLHIYASGHDGSFPASLHALEDCAGSKQDFQWILDNVGYLGEGRSTTDSPTLVVGYDRTLMERGKGTHVVHIDGSMLFMSPEKLREFGISAGQ
ncbi:MAG: hypothetical protein JSU70_23645 [Phycisphaerales bacterium]|nr:MAG: hypothetical protein JSU70_23645 [Phycisphaerales bacterium]